ncbi:MAG: hypothetical protein ACM3YO_05565 [Bacteroidota bacterium]
MKTSEKYDPEVADELLQVAEWTYRSVSDYQASWSQIHPQDQQDWLQSFRTIADSLQQLERWRSQKKLSSIQAERFASIEALRRFADPILKDLEALPVFSPPLGHQMVLDG